MATQIWRYGAQVIGVKNRCRKSEFHCTDKRELGEDTSPDEEKCKALARQWVAQNFKTVKNATATARLLTIENGFESWEMMNEAHNLKFTI